MWRVRALFAPVSVIGMAHVVGGVAALAAPEAAQVSGLSGVTMLSASPEVTGIMLVAVGGAAIASLFYPTRPDIRTALAVPQQIVLMVQLVGIIMAMINGAYPDGYRPSEDALAAAWFILADQSPLIAMCLSHTIEMAFGGLVNVERERYREEVSYLKEQLSYCNKCWTMQKESKFWNEIANGDGPSSPFVSS